MFTKKAVKFVKIIITVVSSFYTRFLYAGSDNIGTVANNITSTFANIAKLLTAGSYIAGIGITIAALFKFKQHKDNPQQVQLGTCVTMLLVGVCLIFLPSIISMGGATLYGSSSVASSATGIENVTGSGSGG